MDKKTATFINMDLDEADGMHLDYREIYDVSEVKAAQYLHAASSNHWDNEDDTYEERIKKICSNFTVDDFENKKESMWFDFDIAQKCTGEESFLDLGCGMGRIAKWVSPLVGKYIGADISKSMIEGAIEYNKKIGTKNCKFYQETCLEKLSDKEGLFDIILCDSVAIHLHKVETYNYINSSYRALKDGGTLFFQLPISGYPNSITMDDLYRETIIREDSDVGGLRDEIENARGEYSRNDMFFSVGNLILKKGDSC